MKNLIKYILLIIWPVVFTSCEDYLDEDIKTFTSPEILMSSKNGVEQAVNGIYAAGKFRWWGGPREIFMLNGFPTDELVKTGASGSRWQLQIYDWDPTNGNFTYPWNAFTQGIVGANMVLDNFPEYGSLGIPDEKQFLDIKRGEALFLRGMHYFYFTNYFGEIPLLTSYNDVELYPTNSTITQLYDQIIADLSEAEKLLPNWQDPTHIPGRATRGAAKSFLGKAYLYRATSKAKEADDFQKAASKFKEVIDNEGYDLWDIYKRVFIPENKNGKEDIYSFQMERDGQRSSGIYIESLPRPSPSGHKGRGNGTLSVFAANSFEEGDKRKEDGWGGTSGLIFTGKYLNRLTGDTLETTNNDKYYHEKYYDPVNSPLGATNMATNFPIMRYADVLLMYAEAINEANKGPDSDAYWAINKVRERAGLNPLSDLSYEEFFDAIYYERLHELWAEGHRWLDMKRWGTQQRAVDERGYNDTYYPPVTVESKHYVFPIPQVEIEANPNLKQNPGY